jgi:hypothetical protein
MFTPACTQCKLLEDIQAMSAEEYVSFACKVFDVGPVDMYKINFAK